MATLEQTRVEEFGNAKQLEEYNNSWTVYNYQGVHWRLFKSWEDAKNWFDEDDDRLVYAEFFCEEKLDDALLKLIE